MMFGLLGLMFGDGTSGCSRGGESPPAPGMFDTGDFTEPADTGTDGDIYDGPTLVEAAFHDCDADSWSFQVVSVGWMLSADLSVFQTGTTNNWEETHSFPDDSADYDPDGWWDSRELTLRHVETPGDVVAGETTLFDCNQGRIDTLTWVVEIFDVDGAWADCGVWGSDAEAVAPECTRL